MERPSASVGKKLRYIISKLKKDVQKWVTALLFLLLLFLYMQRKQDGIYADDYGG